MASSRPTLFRRLLSFPKPAATPAPAARNPMPGPPSSASRTQVPSSSSLLQRLVPRLPRSSSSSSTDGALPRRFFHQNRPALPTEIPLSLRLFPGIGSGGSAVAEKLRDLTPPRVRLEALSPPKERDAAASAFQVSVEEVRKVLFASRKAAARERLRNVGEKSSLVPHAEFLRICLAAAGPEHGARVAEELDAAGDVIVLGDVVFLRPDLVARAIESVIPRAASETRTSCGDVEQRPVTPSPLSLRESAELRDLEFRASQIDARAERGARTELRWGLAVLAAQTLGFARLTFWELSWDVMEPICYYVTSLYFMAGYAFFLRTDRDPSFEVFFRARADARRTRIIAAEGFDAARLQELRARAGRGSFSGKCPCHHHNHLAISGGSESEAAGCCSSTLLAPC